LDQLALGEQAQRLRRAEHTAPVEVRAGDGEDLALGVAGRARRGADRVAGLLREQRLVAPDGVQRLQATLKMRGELVGADLHRGGRFGAVRAAAFRPAAPPAGAAAARRYRRASRGTAPPPRSPWPARRS